MKYECDVCGQIFESKLRWHSCQKEIYTAGLGLHVETQYCNGGLRRIIG